VPDGTDEEGGRAFVLRISLITALMTIALAAPAMASASQPTVVDGGTAALDPGTRGQTLDEISALGARGVRIVMYWHDVAPAADAAAKPGGDLSQPGAYNWGRYADTVEAAQARGLKVLLTLSGPVPVWATKDHDDTLTRPSAAEFQTFATAVARRFGTGVSWYALWNEPNHPAFLKPQYSGRTPKSPRIYRQLYQAGRKGLQAGGSGATPILIGETAPVGTGKVVAPLTFLRSALCLSRSYRKSKSCGKLTASGWAHHPYMNRGGFRAPNSSNDVTYGVLSRLTRALTRAGHAGAITPNLGVYLTEFGVQSRPDTIVGVSLTTQAAWRSRAERLASSNGRVKLFSQYLMRDDADLGGFQTGLRFADGQAKPVYDEFRLPLNAHRSGSRVSIWGLVRPQLGGAGYLDPLGRQKVDVYYRDKGSKRSKKLRSKTTTTRGTWSTSAPYRSGRRFEVRWSAPNGTRYSGVMVGVV
jgi:Cellulase (glycosyl hydrolase family 5)